jgi:hypothetical protein
VLPPLFELLLDAPSDSDALLAVTEAELAADDATLSASTAAGAKANRTAAGRAIIIGKLLCAQVWSDAG